MRVLINGLPGWLGNRFVEVLTGGFEKEGPLNDWKIRCLALSGADTSELKKCARDKQVEWVFGDVTRPETLKDVLQGCDAVFHLVGLIHPRKIAELYRINTEGTRHMLEASVAAGVKRFIYISSNSVGGTQERKSALMREIDPARPYLHYGRSKYLAEEAVNAFGKRLETVILRPCWYYGPNQPPRQSTFFQMIKKGNPLMFGGGENLRSMSYLDNTCQAMLLAAQTPAAAGQTYWIADERPYTTNEIYAAVAGLLGVEDFKPRHLPELVSEACLLTDKMLQRLGLYVKEIHVAGEMNKNIACSIEKAKAELGYHPRIALEEGMRRSILWCRANGQCI